jgi:hypothetical protein
MLRSMASVNSIGDEIEHVADPKGFAIETHHRFVCAALPLNEKDQHLAESVADVPVIWPAPRFAALTEQAPTVL